jgi:hypothetical protein
MAILWWIGATANGDVNVAANWSYLGPFAYPTGYTALVPATNIPKYSDTLIFDRFTPGGNVYPLYSPIGDMRGICGPLGNTAAQWFQEVRVFPECPKPLGGLTAFAFRTSSLLMKRGITGNLPNNYSTSHFIHLYDCSGVTKTQANIVIDSLIRENYFLTGVAGRLKVGLEVGTTIGRDPHSTIFLNNMELQGRTFTSAQYPDPIVLAKQNAAIEAAELSVTGTSAETNQAQVFIRLYPTTNITNNIYLQGREKLVVYRGFNLTNNSINLDSSTTSNPNPVASNAQIEFVSDESSSLTGTGGTEAVYSTRSYIHELNMYGSSSPGYQLLLPKAELNHGVDINTLNFNGAGQITTTNQQIGDAARILRGSINFPNVGNPDNPNGNEKMGIYSDIDNISFGPSGRFIFDNTGSFNTVPSMLRFNLRGNWAYKITPIFED